ncbi:hypothetical protein C3B59_05130 [Cryobacterium zongtaii]|uniref:D-inositol 3-phosphate glycosyltransferase n=1 Tax=Cryobacterium zongtaii TaxID=1259217 RepID=A0A2S3ZLZ7_9MICO|nr:glycosyltransferase family 4 protein [Cryobacterium zongtaii]POH69729.1 hypothetical protein C3B59_05130 [Cryobacterium zongtaii]
MQTGNPLSIVHITPAGGFGRVQHGGAERAVLELAEQTALAGHFVTIIAPGEFLSEVRAPIGVNLVSADVTPRSLISLVRIVRALAPDVVVGHLLRGVILAGLVRLLWRPKAVFVSNLHNSLNQAFEDVGTPPARRFVLRSALSSLHLGSRAATVAISPSNVADLLEHDGFPVKKIELINNWVAPNFAPAEEAALSIRNELSIDRASKIALFVGRLEHQKNPILAVRSVSRLSTPTTLLVAGAGSLKTELADAAVQLGVQIRFLGNVAHVERLMAAADVVLVPSRYEGFGRVAVEALATGTPVVANSVAGLRDALAPFPSDWYSLIETDDLDQWQESIERHFLRDASPAVRASRHETVMHTYGLDAAVARYIRLYRSLLR